MVRLLHRPNFGTMLPRQFGQMQADFEQFLDQVLKSGCDRGECGSNCSAPAALWEDESGFHLEVELPGVQRDDVDLTIEKGTLRVAAERKAPEEERKYWHKERAYGKIQRIVSLPEEVDHDSIDAQLSDGVLHVTVAKKPEVQPKHIKVKEG